MSKARQLADLGNVYDDGALSSRNMVVNGGMTVSQRGSVAAIQSDYGACDRFKLTSNSAARFDTTQSTDVPSGQGFSKSLKLDCSTADTSLAAGEFYLIQQLIEGQNLQQLAYGTSSAKQMTLSFWVKSPKTGIHNLEVESVDGGVFNIHQYTIASANTWQNVKMTIDGYQTTAIANDNTAGLNINWWLLAGTTFSGGSYSENTWHSSNDKRAVGQVNVADSTSNNFYLTGVQLEIGDTSTPFEHRSYADQLQACQRYYYKLAGGTAGNLADAAVGTLACWDTVSAYATIYYPHYMRAAPSMSYGAELADFQIFRAGGQYSATNIVTTGRCIDRSEIIFQSTGNIVAGQAAWVRINDPVNGYLAFDAEL